MSEQWTIENDTGAELIVRAPNGFGVELDANSADPRERFAYFAIRQQARDIAELRYQSKTLGMLAARALGDEALEESIMDEMDSLPDNGSKSDHVIAGVIAERDQLRADLAAVVARAAQAEARLAALAELEKAAAEPVAWMWEDMLGISHTYVSPKRPTWPDAGASPEMAVAINVRPLYAAPPAPVAEIREPTPEECKLIAHMMIGMFTKLGTKQPIAPDETVEKVIFPAVRAVMWPKEGF